MAVNSSDASEKLPWLLNGSLDQEQVEELEEYLRSNEACRRELAQTLWLLRGLPARPKVESLIHLASGGAAEELDAAEQQALRAHLHEHSADGEIVALTRASWAAVHESDSKASEERQPAGVAPVPLAGATPAPLAGATPALEWRRKSQRWRAASLALAATTLLSIAGWWTTWSKHINDLGHSYGMVSLNLNLTRGLAGEKGNTIEQGTERFLVDLLRHEAFEPPFLLQVVDSEDNVLFFADELRYVGGGYNFDLRAPQELGRHRYRVQILDVSGAVSEEHRLDVTVVPAEDSN